jgi:GntR family transcriptional regulator
MAPRSKLSTEPLYTQVRNLLAQRIARGVWSPGSMLPNEGELARELGVSPGTVRKALDVLESDRLVLRRQGRGTSVVDLATGEVAARFSNLRNGKASGSSATWNCWRRPGTRQAKSSSSDCS